MILSDISGTTTLNNSIEMPYLGLGVYKAKDGNEVKNAIHDALNLGYRHIDTASFYHNEEGVGEAIKIAEIDRSEIFITTKVWIDDQGYENTLKAFDTSLNKLLVDYIDLYLIHWPVPNLYVETWKAMEYLYAQGRVKAIGVCNCLEHHLETINAQSVIKPMVLQNEFHPRLVQQPLIDYCSKNKIQYEAWSPLMRGKILNNPTLQKIAQKYHKTTAQIIIRWDLQKGIVTIPKSVHKNRIKENADVFDFELTQEEIQNINALHSNERTGAHPDHFMEHFNK